MLQYDRTRTWASYDDVLPEFKTTVQDELHQLYQQLEDDFGTEIVSLFFGLAHQDMVLSILTFLLVSSKTTSHMCTDHQNDAPPPRDTPAVRSMWNAAASM